MSKQIRTLIIAGVALAALIGLLVALLLLPTPSEDGEGDGTTTATTVPTLPPLVDKTDGDKAVVGSVTVTANDETFTVKADQDGVYRVEAFADLPVDEAAVDALLSGVTAIKPADKVADNATDLSVYGFGEKATRVSVTYLDGSTFAFEVGGDTAAGDGAYLRVAEQTAVYRVSNSLALTLREPATGYVGRKLVETPTLRDGDTKGTAQLMRLELTGKRDPLTVRYKRDTDSEGLTLICPYLIEVPYLTSANATVIGKWQTGFNSLTAVKTVKAYPTAADLAEVGLDHPTTTAVLVLGVYTTSTDADGNTVSEVYNSDTYTLHFSEKNEDGNYYCLVEGTDVLYEVAASDASFVAATFEEIVAETLSNTNIVGVGSVTLTAQDKTSTFVLAHGDDRALTVTLDGKPVSEENFRNLYGLLVSVERYTGISETDKAAFLADFEAPTLTVTLTMADGSTERASLYSGASRALAVLGDGRYFLVKTAQVDTLLRQWDNLLAGKDVIEFF